MDTEVELLIEAQCLAFEAAPTPLIARAVHTLLFTNGGTVEDLYRLCPSVAVFNALTQVLGQFILDTAEVRANGHRIEPLPALRVVH